MAQEHLRLAEEEDSVGLEREVQPLKDSGLGLRREVHERVAANKQVEVRDRSVLKQVVAPEDEAPPQFLSEGEALHRRLEEPSSPFRIDAVQVALGEGRLAGRRQRL